jgi:hypothetical protein
MINLTLIILSQTKSIMNLSQLSHLELGSILPGHRIKSYGLIECDKLYLLTDVNDKFSMVNFSCYWDIVINQELILSLSNDSLELYPHILIFYLDTMILSFDQHWWYFHCDKVSSWISDLCQSDNFIFT